MVYIRLVATFVLLTVSITADDVSEKQTSAGYLSSWFYTPKEVPPKPASFFGWLFNWKSSPTLFSTGSSSYNPFLYIYKLILSSSNRLEAPKQPASPSLVTRFIDTVTAAPQWLFRTCLAPFNYFSMTEKVMKMDERSYSRKILDYFIGFFVNVERSGDGSFNTMGDKSASLAYSQRRGQGKLSQLLDISIYSKEKETVEAGGESSKFSFIYKNSFTDFIAEEFARLDLGSYIDLDMVLALLCCVAVGTLGVRLLKREYRRYKLIQKCSRQPELSKRLNLKEKSQLKGSQKPSLKKLIASIFLPSNTHNTTNSATTVYTEHKLNLKQDRKKFNSLPSSMISSKQRFSKANLKKLFAEICDEEDSIDDSMSEKLGQDNTMAKIAGGKKSCNSLFQVDKIPEKGKSKERKNCSILTVQKNQKHGRQQKLNVDMFNTLMTSLITTDENSKESDLEDTKSCKDTFGNEQQQLNLQRPQQQNGTFLNVNSEDLHTQEQKEREKNKEENSHSIKQEEDPQRLKSEHQKIFLPENPPSICLKNNTKENEAMKKVKLSPVTPENIEPVGNKQLKPEQVHDQSKLKSCVIPSNEAKKNANELKNCQQQENSAEFRGIEEVGASNSEKKISSSSLGKQVLSNGKLHKSHDQHSTNDSLERSCDQKLSNDKLHESRDPKLSNDKLQESHDPKLSNDKLHESHDPKLSNDKLRESNCKELSNHQLQESEDENDDCSNSSVNDYSSSEAINVAPDQVKQLVNKSLDNLAGTSSVSFMSKTTDDPSELAASTLGNSSVMSVIDSSSSYLNETDTSTEESVNGREDCEKAAQCHQTSPKDKGKDQDERDIRKNDELSDERCLLPTESPKFNDINNADVPSGVLPMTSGTMSTSDEDVEYLNQVIKQASCSLSKRIHYTPAAKDNSSVKENSTPLSHKTALNIADSRDGSYSSRSLSQPRDACANPREKRSGSRNGYVAMRTSSKESYGRRFMPYSDGSVSPCRRDYNKPTTYKDIRRRRNHYSHKNVSPNELYINTSCKAAGVSEYNDEQEVCELAEKKSVKELQEFFNKKQYEDDMRKDLENIKQSMTKWDNRVTKLKQDFQTKTISYDMSSNHCHIISEDMGKPSPLSGKSEQSHIKSKSSQRDTKISHSVLEEGMPFRSYDARTPRNSSSKGYDKEKYGSSKSYMSKKANRSPTPTRGCNSNPPSPRPNAKSSVSLSRDEIGSTPKRIEATPLEKTPVSSQSDINHSVRNKSPINLSPRGRYTSRSSLESKGERLDKGGRRSPISSPRTPVVSLSKESTTSSIVSCKRMSQIPTPKTGRGKSQAKTSYQSFITDANPTPVKARTAECKGIGNQNREGILDNKHHLCPSPNNNNMCSKIGKNDKNFNSKTVTKVQKQEVGSHETGNRTYSREPSAESKAVASSVRKSNNSSNSQIKKYSLGTGASVGVGVSASSSRSSGIQNRAYGETGSKNVIKFKRPGSVRLSTSREKQSSGRPHCQGQNRSGNNTMSTSGLEVSGMTDKRQLKLGNQSSMPNMNLTPKNKFGQRTEVSPRVKKAMSQAQSDSKLEKKTGSKASNSSFKKTSSHEKFNNMIKSGKNVDLSPFLVIDDESPLDLSELCKPPYERSILANKVIEHKWDYLLSVLRGENPTSDQGISLDQIRDSSEHFSQQDIPLMTKLVLMMLESHVKR